MQPLYHKNLMPIKLQCSQGHPLKDDNLYVVPKTGRHECKTCKRLGSAKRYIQDLLNGRILIRPRGLKYEAFGERKTLREWSREYGIPAKRIWTRINRDNWSNEKAIKTKVCKDPRFKTQTHCKKGHALVIPNLYITPSTGDRQCKICLKEMAHINYIKRGGNSRFTDKEKSLKYSKARHHYRKKISSDVPEELGKIIIARCNLYSLILAKTRGLKHAAFGKEQTLKEWASEYGITHSCLLARRHKGLSLEVSLLQETTRNCTHRVFGKSQTLKQWASEYGMNYKHLWGRINTCGWSIEKALTTPVRAHR